MGADFNTITLLIGAASLVLLLLELRSNHVWNQKRTSYELMNEMITSGRFTGALERLQANFGWDLLKDDRTYADVAAALAPDDAERRRLLDQEMVTIMRHLEMLSISIRHGIVSETICREGFSAFFTAIFRASLPFMEQERERRANVSIYEWFECFARKWNGEPVAPRRWPKLRTASTSSAR